MRLSVRQAGTIVALIVALSGCGSDGPSGPQAGSITVNAGNNQVQVAGQVLPNSLEVLVQDVAGAPMAGVTVTWSIGTGAGAVSPASGVTSAAGITRTAFTLGAGAGTQTVSAAVAGLAPVPFAAVAQIQGATQMANNTIGPLSDTVLGTNAQPLVVFVQNQNGVPVPGVIVNWSASGGGQVSAPTMATDAGGQSIVTYTFGPVAGNQGAQASVTGLVGSPIGFTLNATAGNAVSIARSAGEGVIVLGGAQVIHTVVARDAQNNPRNGVTVDWALGTGGGSVTPPQNITGGAGTASATRTTSAAIGFQTATATAAGLTGSPLTFTTVVPAVVNVSNDIFTQNSVTIPTGGAVRWQWQGTTNPHNITFAVAPGVPANEPNRTSGTVTRTFNAAGTFNYECTVHLGMTGVVNVN